MKRSEMWAALGEEPLDLLVIGGGINGVGVARDAALRGLKVGLVEARDLAYGTSSRSSKLVHGGLRYLEMMEFGLVFESVSERRILMDIAPHLVHPLGFLFPIYKDSPKNLTMIKTGLLLYEGLSLFRSPKRHQRLKPADIGKKEPVLTQKGLKGAPLYYDCSTDDARLTLENGIDAARAGATVVTWARAIEFVLDEKTGRINAVVVEDSLTGEQKKVSAAVVVNATGPWTDKTRGLGKEDYRDLLRPTKGVHIVVQREKLPVNHAVVCFHPDDERVLFAVPWGDQTYVGTTDTDFEGDPGKVYASGSDVEYLTQAARRYFPEHPIEKADVISTWAGLRPLIAPGGEGGEVSESKVSREHQVLVDQDGMITVAGGKLTTYRKMSAEVVEAVLKFLRLIGKEPAGIKEVCTSRRLLPGAEGWPHDAEDEVIVSILEKRTVEESGELLDEATASYLVATYGVRAPEVGALVKANEDLQEKISAGRPELLAQVDFGVFEEFATTVTDIMLQRTQLYYRAADQGLEGSRKVSKRMAHLLGWSEERRIKEVERFHHDVHLSQKWRHEA